MNEEFEDYTPNQPANPSERQIKKVKKPLNPGEELEKAQKKSSTLIFRLKRNAEVEPLDIMAIDSMNISQMSKKVQKNHIRDIENIMNNLTINENNTEASNKQQDPNAVGGWVHFEEGIDDLRLVLRRVEPSNIFDLAQDEETFRKSYKTVYNDMTSKLKREAKIDKIRKNLVSKSKNLKIVDINLKNEFKQNVLYCNNQPMLVTDLSGKDALKDQIKTEDDDGSYDYYFLQQVPKKEASGAEMIHFHDSTKNLVRSHFVEEEMELVYDQQGNDSEDEINQNPDNVDSNDENNPDNDYPDEEDEEEDDENYGGRGRRRSSEDEDGFESDYGDYDPNDDDEEEDYYSRVDREYQEEKFSSNFYSKIKNMATDNYKWPGSKKY